MQFKNAHIHVIHETLITLIVHYVDRKYRYVVLKVNR